MVTTFRPPERVPAIVASAPTSTEPSQPLPRWHAPALPVNFPAVLSAQQLAEITAQVAAVDMANLPLADISSFGLDAEQNLHRVLDSFLTRIEHADAPRLFKLVHELKTAVDAEDLPALAARILDAKPTLGEKLGSLLSKKGRQAAALRVYEETCRVLSGKSQKLSQLVAGMEQELRREQSRLAEELRQLESLKEHYRDRFLDFAAHSLFLTFLLDKAKQESQYLLAANACNASDSFLTHEWHDKLQALESRALALEGTLSRLPADQLLIRQLQHAAVATLQELATTTNARFASIKMTLLTIHGARMTQDVQRLAAQGAALEKNLTAVRQTLMQDVVLNAAHAPGDNRLAQAQQLQQIVAETARLQELADAANASNQAKFAEARHHFATARQAMLELGKRLQPGETLQKNL